MSAPAGQILGALRYLHEDKCILHRDLKSQNGAFL